MRLTKPLTVDESDSDDHGETHVCKESGGSYTNRLVSEIRLVNNPVIDTHTFKDRSR